MLLATATSPSTTTGAPNCWNNNTNSGSTSSGDCKNKSYCSITYPRLGPEKADHGELTVVTLFDMKNDLQILPFGSSIN